MGFMSAAKSEDFRGRETYQGCCGYSNEFTRLQNSFLSSNINAPLLLGLYIAFPLKIKCKRKLFDEINSFNLHGYQKSKNNIKI